MAARGSSCHCYTELASGSGREETVGASVSGYRALREGAHPYAGIACTHELRRLVAGATDLRQPLIGERVTATGS